MKRSTMSVRGWVFPVLFLLCSSGCAQVVNTGLGVAGLNTPAHDPFGSGAGERVALTPRGNVVLSGYQHAPTLDWSTLGMGQPFNVSRSLFQTWEGNEGCQVVHRGFTTLMAVPEGAEAKPLHRVGSLEVGVAGDLAPWHSLMRQDAQALGMQAIAAGARKGTVGAACGYSLFVYLRMSTSRTNDVAVHR